MLAGHEGTQPAGSSMMGVFLCNALSRSLRRQLGATPLLRSCYHLSGAAVSNPKSLDEKTLRETHSSLSVEGRPLHSTSRWVTH